MITHKQVTTRRIEVEWTTGEDYQYLHHLLELIDSRNKDKEEIIGLKEELV